MRKIQIEPAAESVKGVACAASAYMIWGISPAYFKLLKGVPAFEILMHRIVWSFLLLLPVVLLTRRGGELAAALRSARTMLMLLGTTMIVGLNWFLFIWAINNDHILQTSLGYYIAPLVNISRGMIFLKERLRPLQVAAVAVAAAGVTCLTYRFGEFPWVALALAVSFGFYGLIRKVAPVGATVGLSVELMILFLAAAGYLCHLDWAGRGTFMRLDIQTDLELIGCAFVTGLPLLLFTTGARLLHLTTIGFLQYIAPTGTFMLAVFVYKEPLHQAQVTAFIFIWAALVLYSTDSVRYHRKKRIQPA